MSLSNMKIGALLPISAALVLPFFASCGDDPKLIEKRDNQKRIISDLEQDVLQFRSQLSSEPEPRDQEKEIVASEMLLRQLRNEAEQIRKEIQGLEQEKSKIESQFAAYKNKYQVN